MARRGSDSDGTGGYRYLARGMAYRRTNVAVIGRTGAGRTKDDLEQHPSDADVGLVIFLAARLSAGAG